MLGSANPRAARDGEGSSQTREASTGDGFTEATPEWGNWIELPPDANPIANCWTEIEELDTGDYRVSRLAVMTAEKMGDSP